MKKLIIPIVILLSSCANYHVGTYHSKLDNLKAWKAEKAAKAAIVKNN